MRRLTQGMIKFREDPNDATRVIRPARRRDELGQAERELAMMQETVRQALLEKERLAALGAAVTKINHDLKNILATMRLLADGISASAAPELKRVAPGLAAAIDRAVALTTGTLDYTRERAAPLHRSRFALAGLAEEIAEMEFREGAEGFLIDNRVAPSLIAAADRDQLFRVLHNLAQNAAQSGAHRLSFRAAVSDMLLLIEVADDGPGLPPKARENLFRPFAGSARPGGTGLGLAIAREVMRAHGGDIALDEEHGRRNDLSLELAPIRRLNAFLPS